MEDLFHPGDLGSLGVGCHDRRVIPATDHVDVIPITAFSWWALKAHQQLRDVLLGNLVFIRHRDAIAIVIYGQYGRAAQHADGVDRFPEQPSAELAFPMVLNATSSPSCENWANWRSSSSCRYSLEA